LIQTENKNGERFKKEKKKRKECIRPKETKDLNT